MNTIKITVRDLWEMPIGDQHKSFLMLAVTSDKLERTLDVEIDQLEMLKVQSILSDFDDTPTISFYAIVEPAPGSTHKPQIELLLTGTGKAENVRVEIAVTDENRLRRTMQYVKTLSQGNSVLNHKEETMPTCMICGQTEGIHTYSGDDPAKTRHFCNTCVTILREMTGTTSEPEEPEPEDILDVGPIVEPVTQRPEVAEFATLIDQAVTDYHADFDNRNKELQPLELAVLLSEKTNRAIMEIYKIISPTSGKVIPVSQPADLIWTVEFVTEVAVASMMVVERLRGMAAHVQEGLDNVAGESSLPPL